MKQEIIYESMPFILKILKNDLDGYILIIKEDKIYEVDKEKLQENLLSFIETLKKFLEALKSA
jgi:hypothetical protein